MSRLSHVVHAFLGAMSILAIGIVLGVLLDRLVLRPDNIASAQVEVSQTDGERHENFLREMANDLNLSTDEAEAVHDILRRH